MLRGASRSEQVPTGEIGWSRLIDYVLESDDRVERYFLEVKSEADLNSKRDQAKVAKYILGAANRDLAQAQRRFGGHALMVLGVGNGTVVGVRPFEAKDLGRAIQRLIGADGPGWDFERIRVDGHDVIIIVVDPPTGDMWTCRADAPGLTDGGIYVRADGETRQATGDEVRTLITRATSRPPTVDVDVAIEGEVLAIQVDESVLTAWIQTTAEQLRAQAASTKSRSPFGWRDAWTRLLAHDGRGDGAAESSRNRAYPSGEASLFDYAHGIAAPRGDSRKR